MGAAGGGGSSKWRTRARAQGFLQDLTHPGLPTLILMASADLSACVPAIVPPRSSVSLKVGPLMDLALRANEHGQTDCICFSEHWTALPCSIYISVCVPDFSGSPIVSSPSRECCLSNPIKTQTLATAFESSWSRVIVAPTQIWKFGSPPNWGQGNGQLPSHF